MSAAYLRMQNALKRRTKRGRSDLSPAVTTCQDGSILAEIGRVLFGAGGGN
jgi:hypothetical protein